MSIADEIRQAIIPGRLIRVWLVDPNGPPEAEGIAIAVERQSCALHADCLQVEVELPSRPFGFTRYWPYGCSFGLEDGVLENPCKSYREGRVWPSTEIEEVD